MVSLGTTDRATATKLCVQVTALMDQMLDNDLHIALPAADVAAFFKAELVRCVDAVRRVRMVERMDGSFTTEKARRNRLEAFVLRGMVEDGLREEMAPERLDRLDDLERPIAQDIQSKMFREFISPAFNAEIQARANAGRGLTQFDILQLRWAAVEARMAAYEAAEVVPLHNSAGAREAAVSLLSGIMHEAMGTQPQASTPQNAVVEAHQQEPTASKPCPEKFGQAISTEVLLTPGVALIEGRVTGRALNAQLTAARAQPRDRDFDGSAANAVIERRYGCDIAGTAVRMIRRSTAKAETQGQKLKSVILFMYITGVQKVSDIRQHHLDTFSRALEKKMPPLYWKKDAELDLTGAELMTQAASLGAKLGLSPSTIERHLGAISALIHHARTEGNIQNFVPNMHGLVPVDARSDDEKREPFALDELKTLFSHPLFRGCKSKGRRHAPGNLMIKDHHFWVNLLLVYTGARRAEIAGLLTTDFGMDGVIPFVSIRPNHLRGLKNASAKRRLPLHPQIMEAGFAEFVERVRKRGDLALFPECIPARTRHLAHKSTEETATHDPKFGDTLDHLLRETLRRSLDGNPRSLSCHSFRHYVNEHFSNLRQDGTGLHVVPEIDRMDLLGHKPAGVNLATYRRAEKPLGPLYAAILTLPSLF